MSTISNEISFGLESQIKTFVTWKISLQGTSTGLTLILTLESDLHVRISHNQIIFKFLRFLKRLHTGI